MDSLTSSTQCTSSTTYTAGLLSDPTAESTQPRQPPAPCLRIGHRQLVGAIPDAEQIVQQYEILCVGTGQPCSNPFTCGGCVKLVDLEDGPQQPRHRVERDVPGMGLTERGEHLRAAGDGDRRDLPDQPALTDARRPDHTNRASGTAKRLVEHPCEPVHFPLAPDHRRLVAACAPARRNAEKTTGRRRIAGALDAHQLRIAQFRAALHQPCAGFTQDHATCRSDGFHPLCHADLVTDRCVTARAGPDLARDNLAGIDTNAQPECHSVASHHLRSKRFSSVLDTERRQAGPKCVVLQRGRRTTSVAEPGALPQFNTAGPARSRCRH